MDQITQLAKQLYASADEDLNGTIDYSEARQLLVNICGDLSQDQMNEIIYVCDLDGDGRIDFYEFKQLIYVCGVAELASFPSVFFYAMDTNCNGIIGFTELKANYKRFLKYMGEYSADVLIQRFKGQSKLEYDVFAREWAAVMKREKQ